METLRYALTTTYYPPFHLGGDAVHVQLLANELATRGHDVHVFFGLDAYAVKKGIRQVRRFQSQLQEKPGITLHPFKTAAPAFSTISAYSLGASRLANGIEQGLLETKPDIIHHHNISGIGIRILRIKAPRVLFTAHDHWPICQMSGFLKADDTPCTEPRNCGMCSIRNHRPPQLWRKKNPVGSLFSNVQWVIAPSEYLERMLKSYGGFGNVTVLPNFVPDWHRGEFHDIAEHSFFLYVGALERNKGISKLISHFLSDGYYADKVLKVVGSGSQERMLRRQLDESENPNRVHLIGSRPREELFTLYNEAAALVVPSQSPENSPLVCLEALCGGTPVVGTRIGGIPEIVSLISEKLLFDPGDFPTMRGILRTLLEDPPERGSIRQIYKEHFSPDSYIKGLWRLIS